MTFAAQRIYLDANAIIAVLEFPANVPQLIDQVMIPIAREKITGIASRLTLAECMVKPLRQNDAAARQLFENFLLRGPIQLFSIFNEILDQATVIRAKYGFHLLDAIHLATAVTTKCDAIISDDLEWQKFPGLPIYDFNHFL